MLGCFLSIIMLAPYAEISLELSAIAENKCAIAIMITSVWSAILLTSLM